MFASTGYASTVFNMNLSRIDFTSVTNTKYMLSHTGASSAKFSTNIIINSPNIVDYEYMFERVATKTGAQIVVYYIDDDTSALVDLLIATKTDTSNVIKGGMKIEDFMLLTVGDEVVIGSERFNILSINGDEIRLFAKYNLSNNFVQTTAPNNKPFATTNGWEFNPGPKDVDIQVWSVNPKNYVNAYVEYLKGITGDSNLSGDLIAMSELYTLGCDVNANYNYKSTVNCNDSQYGSWLVNGQMWWTKSAYPHTEIDIWKVETSGKLNGNRHTSSNGIRPVITVSKDALYQIGDNVKYIKN
jgi:hypothetical protein